MYIHIYIYIYIYTHIDSVRKPKDVQRRASAAWCSFSPGLLPEI